MELSFKELKKRDVVNIVDGSSYGRIVDLNLAFPQGNLTSITVMGRSSGFFSKLFGKNRITIYENDIIKIGGDVILVNVKCGDNCANVVNINPLPNKKGGKPTPPPCPPPCPPKCPPPCEPNFSINPRQDGDDPPFENRIDLNDY